MEKPYSRAGYAVWELTLKCNLACGHCGSRAGDARDDELSPAEAQDLVRQLAEAGITEVTIEGGEAFLRPDWLDIARAITAHGMTCTMVTGGYGLSAATAMKMKEAGIARCSVSVDGLAEVHDRVRGKLGSWVHCFKTLEHLRSAGIKITGNTQLNRLSAPQLPELYERLRDAGAVAWQLAVTSPMGNGADNHWLLLQPAEMDDLFRVLARVAVRATAEGKLSVAPGNSVGYFSPFDHVLLERSDRKMFTGCNAGLSVLGIHADGSIKGCPTLPTDYIGGNIREKPLSEIVKSKELTFNMDAGTEDGTKHMWGFCGTCEYNSICRGGCTQVAHVLFNRNGNNPYCHHRAVTQAAAGIRERVVRAERPPGHAFDHGMFQLIEEPVGAPWPEDDPGHFTYDKVHWPPGWEAFPEPERRHPLHWFIQRGLVEEEGPVEAEAASG